MFHLRCWAQQRQCTHAAASIVTANLVTSQLITAASHIIVPKSAFGASSGVALQKQHRNSHCAHLPIGDVAGEPKWEGAPCNAEHGALTTATGTPAWGFALSEGAPVLDTWPPLPGVKRRAVCR